MLSQDDNSRQTIGGYQTQKTSKNMAIIDGFKIQDKQCQNKPFINENSRILAQKKWMRTG